MAVRAGADLVLGSGPHVLRGMEIYRGRLIAYSLGNFSGFHNFATEGVLGASAVLHVTLDPDGAFRSGRIASVRLVEAGQPVPDPSGEGARIIAQLSREDLGGGRGADRRQRPHPRHRRRGLGWRRCAGRSSPAVLRILLGGRAPDRSGGARCHRSALVVASPASAAAEPTPPRPKLHRCDLGMPRPFECGHIMVPVPPRPTRRSARPRSPSRSATAATSRQPSLGTIFAMDGGPGYAATAKPYASSLIAALGPVLRRRDLVLYDMRGTGLSDAVDCPALQAGLIQEPIAIGECANQLGPSYAGYTSGEGAEDLDQLRRALGLGKIFFYGDSYGTFFGQAYAVRHPGSLRGLILDSAYPGNDPYYRTLLPAGLHGLRIACR